MRLALPGLARRHALPAAAVLLLSALLLGNKGFRRLVSHTLQLRRTRVELSTLQREEVQLKERVAAARRDDRALERAARVELGYLKPGELEYRFPPPVAK